MAPGRFLQLDPSEETMALADGCNWVLGTEDCTPHQGS